MVTPDEIENKVFSLVRRGYDPAEVDDFLQEVAATVAQAQGGLATPPAPVEAVEAVDEAATADEPVDELTIGGPDDFGRLGEEIAQILRQAHDSVAEMRHRAEAEAALTRQQAQQEADALKGDADRDRQSAAVELEAARQEAARILADVETQAEQAAERAAELARSRADEVVDHARVEARDAVLVQRNVRGRLEVVRNDIDDALDHLVEEDQDLFESIDLTDATVEETGGPVVTEREADLPGPGQGPPTPPVPPPARPTPNLIEGLPYDTDDDEELDDGGPEEPTIDLTDEAPGDEAPPTPDDPNPFPLPPNPPAPLDDGGGAAAAVPDAPTGDDGDEDALAQMVKNAVENALRRRKGDGEPPSNGS